MAVYAYYALHKLHIRPREFIEMDMREKAFVIAAIDERVKAEKQSAKRQSRAARPRKR